MDPLAVKDHITTYYMYIICILYIIYIYMYIYIHTRHGDAWSRISAPGSTLGRNENTDSVQDGDWGAAVCVRETQQFEQILNLVAPS